MLLNSYLCKLCTGRCPNYRDVVAMLYRLGYKPFDPNSMTSMKGRDMRELVEVVWVHDRAVDLSIKF